MVEVVQRSSYAPPHGGDRLPSFSDDPPVGITSVHQVHDLHGRNEEKESEADSEQHPGHRFRLTVIYVRTRHLLPVLQLLNQFSDDEAVADEQDKEGSSGTHEEILPWSYLCDVEGQLRDVLHDGAPCCQTAIFVVSRSICPEVVEVGAHAENVDDDDGQFSSLFGA